MPVQIHDRTKFGIIIDDWERLRGTPVESWVKKNFRKVWDLYTTRWSYVSCTTAEAGTFEEPDTSLAIVRTSLGTNATRGDRYRRETLTPEIELGTIVPLRTISDDGNTISSFPLEVLGHLSEEVPTLDLGTKGFTAQRLPQIKARQSDRARIDRYAEWRSQPIYSDILGAFSFFGDLDAEEAPQSSYLPEGLTSGSILAQLLAQTASDDAGRPKKIPTYRIGSLYRGGGPEPTVEKWQSKLSSVGNGSTIFAFKREVEVLNQFSLVWETKTMICLGTFEPLHKAIQYKKARAFWPGLLQSFAGRSTERWFDKKAWREKRSEHWSEICKFWDTPMQTFADTTMDAPPDISVQLTGEALEDKHFAWIESADGISRNPEEIKYQKIAKKAEEVEAKKQAAASKLLRHNEGIDSYRYNITQLDRQLESIQAQLERNRSAMQTAENGTNAIQLEVDALTPAALSIQTALQAQKTIRDTAIEAMIATPTSGGWVSNIEKSMGIQIREIFYDDRAGLRSHKLSENPDAPRKVKSEGWKLKMIQFTTNKPTVIHVDQHEHGSACKKVAGGPWHVTLTSGGTGRPRLDVRLLSGASIYGKKNNNYKVHPHTNQFTIRGSDYERHARSLIASDHNGCLGEAEPVLYKAFEDHNVKMAIIGAMTWLGNANGSDPWGKHWRWFPKASDVNLEGTNFLPGPDEIEAAQEVTIDDLITTDEGMDVLAARLLGNIDEYEIAIPGHTEPQAVPYQAIVSEDLTNRNNLLNAIQALENRTVQRGGYVPYVQR